MKLNPAPPIIGGFEVACYSPIDHPHKFTGKTKQIVNGKLMGSLSGLAICHLGSSSECYLFGCDAQWKVVTDTWHSGIIDAKEQAEFEYEGMSKTWIDVK